MPWFGILSCPEVQCCVVAPTCGRTPEVRYACRRAGAPRDGRSRVVIGEFRYVGQFTDSGRAFDVPNFFVARVRDGLIVEGRDYADHASFASAAGTWASW
jgi:hypothetical protein